MLWRVYEMHPKVGCDENMQETIDNCSDGDHYRRYGSGARCHDNIHVWTAGENWTHESHTDGIRFRR